MDRGTEILARLVGNGDARATQSASSAATAALRHRNGDAAERAAQVMVWLGSVSVEPLIEVLEEDGACVPAIRALGRLRDLRATEALVPLVSDDDPEVRRAAVVALARTSDPRTRSVLLDACGDPDHRVREAAIAAIQKLSLPMIVGPEVAESAT
jgi:hypothetical protein